MPSLQDDGQTVTLDLHGSTVDEAIRLTQATLREATRRGRSRVTLIHGTSTSDPRYRNRTIKHELYALLERGGLEAAVTSTWRGEGRLVLSLDVGPSQDATPIRLMDVW